MHWLSSEENHVTRAAAPRAGRRVIRGALLILACVALAGVAIPASPAGAANACQKQCAIVGQACLVPFRIAFQTQKAGCTGLGKRLCILAAKVMFSAGRQLCRSTTISCRQCCRKGAPAVCRATCGDGILAPDEQCDPPGWAACTDGAACGSDCRCPETSESLAAP